MAAALVNVLAAIQQNLGPTISTTDATQTTAARFVTKSDAVYFVSVRVVATETADHDEGATYWRQACYKNDGGTLAIVGAVRTVVTDNETTAGWDVTISSATEDVEGDGVNEKTITVLVTGAAATLITWRINTEIIEVV